MKIQAFIFNWPGKKQHAVGLERLLLPDCPDLCVINSDDGMRESHPNWVHIGKDGYFTDQWNAALARFDADILFHVQADVWPNDVKRMLAECARLMRECAVGIYAPDIDYTSHRFRRQDLVPVEDGVYEVPTTDCSCWALSADVLRATPHVDPEVNRLGWGIDFLVSTVALRLGKKVVRDFRFRADHPAAQGYDAKKAFAQWSAWKKSLDPDIRATMDNLESQYNRILVTETKADRAWRGVKQMFNQVLPSRAIRERNHASQP